MPYHFLCGVYMNLLIIGGDTRQKFLAENLKQNGHNVEHIVSRNQIPDNFDKYSCIVFPLPTTKDGITVHNTLSDEKIFIAEMVKKINKQKVLCGNYRFVNIDSIDYAASDDTALLNAVPTAEGALELAIKNTPFTIWKSNCLVVGNGKCGKILADRLCGLKANVTVSARRDNDFAFIDAYGMNFINTDNLQKYISNFDIIFNTVNAPVIDKNVLNKCKSDCLLIELASAPFGIDFKIAEQLNLRVIKAPGLPGKIAPKTAADILTNSILKLI